MSRLKGFSREITAKAVKIHIDVEGQVCNS